MREQKCGSVNETDTIKAIHAGLDDLLLVSKNINVTGPVFLRMDLTDGKPMNFGFVIEKKSCIPRKDVIK